MERGSLRETLFWELRRVGLRKDWEQRRLHLYEEAGVGGWIWGWDYGAGKEGMNAVRRKGREECRGGVERNGAKDRV